MKRSYWLLAAVLVAVVALPGIAGEKKHEKCNGDPADCLAKMQQKIANKAWLGVEMNDTDDDRYQITRVVEGSPAEKAGFEKGDVLIAMNGVDYLPHDKEAMGKAWGETSPGSTATYVVLRKGAKLKLKAELGHVPDDVMAQWIGEHMLKSHLVAPEKVAQKD